MLDIENLKTLGTLASSIPKNDPLLFDILLDRYHAYPFTLNSEAVPSPIQALHQQALGGNIESIYTLAEHYWQGNEVPEDHYLAFRLIRYAAEHNYQPAFSALGKCYAYGIGTQQNHLEAVHWLLKTDYAQDVDMLGLMGLYYFNGTGVAQDKNKAYDYWLDVAEKGHSAGFHYCQLAADAGYARGQFVLGHFYQFGIDTPTDIHKALQLFHQAAEQNYAPAQCRLGILYGDGIHSIERDPVVAMQWFQRAAAQKDTVAQYRLAHCLLDGDGIEQNKDQAARIWQELSQPTPTYPKGNPASQHSLGILLIDKEYSDYNPKEGIKYLYNSAAQDFAPAQTSLGLLYYEGLNDVIEQNYKQARHWFQKAAKQGDRIAQYHLGDIYYNGDGVPMNSKKAFKWYKQSMENGYALATQKVTHCYLDGVGTKQDDSEGYVLLASLALSGDEEALTLLKSAATSGNSAAEFGLWCYYREQNKIKAGREWLEKSADKGNADALCGLALLYENEGDDKKTLQYFFLAADRGSADAQTRLGLMFENVTDRKAPENEVAFKWMKAAADQKHPQAYYYLGNFYRDGTWVDADAIKAFECYSKSAELGNADAIDRLGECYVAGTGVTVNEPIAFQYFQCAAGLGNPKGLCNLGFCYLHGFGCHQDTELAFRWIAAAIATGHPIVFQILRCVGLDIGKLSDGYKQFESSKFILPLAKGVGEG